MRRRTLLQLPVALPAVLMGKEQEPKYRIVSRYEPHGDGMPGRFPGRVVTVKSPSSVDETSGAINQQSVNAMIDRGMSALAGTRDAREAWAGFFRPSDAVGIKVNCSGAPQVCSRPEIVGEIVRNLITVGLKPQNIWIYERFGDQLESVHYDRFVPAGVNIVAVETPRKSILGYDPNVYVETNFFGEEDTRSNLVRLVSERFDKIINVPNMKDHGAAGVTGCLKNIAYGNFSNVARSHYGEKTNTKTFIGTLASVEPLRSKTVLNVMDGLRGVWHGGPFVRDVRFTFYPKQMKFGTDPVAMDRLLLDVIEEKRRSEKAVSVWDRDPKYLGAKLDPNQNPFIREPGHIGFAGTLGLGTYDRAAIRETVLQLA
ncbi:MAG: hypothetical protein JWO80_1130 [Bryobacterales bacterium]|nr:hypothetical protein [Bryobacterales bacterium]